MKKKILLSSSVICGLSMPLMSLISCGTSGSNADMSQAARLADDIVEKVSQSTASVLTFEAFPAADLYDVKTLADLGLILPNPYPETPLSVRDQKHYLFVLNKNPTAQTAQVEVSASAGFDENTSFTKHFWFTFGTFNARLDLASFNDLNVNPGDTVVAAWNNNVAVSSTDLVKGLNDLVLNALKSQVVNVAATNYDTLNWTKEDGTPVDNTTDFKNKINTFQTTITAKTNDPYLKNQKNVLKIMVPKLNQLKLSTLQNITADAKYFSSIATKSAASRSDVNACLTNFMVDYLQNLSDQQQLGLTIGADNFLANIEKNNNLGYLDDPTDLTKGSTIVDIHIFANLRNVNLIGQLDDWLITIPALS